MKRNIIRIDETLCDGCGLCAQACHEGAIAIINGKARLVSETYCDGLGTCLGECPQNAITIETRDAAPFDEKVAKRMPAVKQAAAVPAEHDALPCGCPGSTARTLKTSVPVAAAPGSAPKSALGQWPIQLRLVNPSMPFLQNADLLICADCVPVAVPDFHPRYLSGHAMVLACPKLDDLDEITERLTAIFKEVHPRRITVLRMEVPCCGGLTHAAHQAMENAGIHVPFEVHIIRIEDGQSSVAKDK